METGIPTFTFSEEEIAKIREAAGQMDLGEDGVPAKRGPGRPKGSKNKSTIARAAVNSVESSVTPESTDSFSQPFQPAPLTKRDEREVAKRLVNILTGATGMAGVVKPYLEMTDDEAQAIAEPLASYLVRNEATQTVAREILENYDLLAMTMGVGAYSVRVYGDRKREVSESRPANATAMERVGTSETRDNGRGPDEVSSTKVSIPDVSRGGSIPFDV